MVQPQGHDTLSPWAAEDDSAGIDDGAGAPSSPLVLGDVDGVSITGQMQEQLPQQSAPAHGRELSGEVASLGRSEEHTSELQSRRNLVCRLLLEKKKNEKKKITTTLDCSNC